jgi:glycosyltransferase involved in cell wall biosynthesis
MRTTEEKPHISIVVPAHNEAGAISALYQKIKSVCDKNEIVAEIIFVDDGSFDKTSKILAGLPGITIIRLRKKFGQTAALDAGIKKAKKEYIVTLDGDGQNDPADIPKLLKKIKEGNYDCICGWRKYRKDPIFKRLASRGAHILRSMLIHDGIHDSGCTLKIFKRECFDNIDLYGEMHRFIPALLKIRGYRIGEEVVKHHSRKYGKTKYNWKRTIKGALDILSLWFWGKYVNRPLHLFGTLGIAVFLASFMAGGIAFYNKIYLGADLSSSSLTYLAVSGTFAGFQLIIFGLLMDMVVKNFYATKKITNYEIAEIIEN